MFRLADYLEQHGRATRRMLCPPASFWDAACTHLTHPEDLNSIAEAALIRHRLQWPHHLHHRAADVGDTNSLVRLAGLREEAGDLDGAEALYQQAANTDNPVALVRLAGLREEAGDLKGAAALYRRLADSGKPVALLHPSMRAFGGVGLKARWPYGLDADGTPSQPWE